MTALIFEDNYIKQSETNITFEQYYYFRAHHPGCVLLYGMPINKYILKRTMNIFNLKKEGII